MSLSDEILYCNDTNEIIWSKEPEVETDPRFIRVEKVKETVKRLINDIECLICDQDGHYVDIRCVRSIIKTRFGEKLI